MPERRTPCRLKRRVWRQSPLPASARTTHESTRTTKPGGAEFGEARILNPPKTPPTSTQLKIVLIGEDYGLKVSIRRKKGRTISDPAFGL